MHVRLLSAFGFTSHRLLTARSAFEDLPKLFHHITPRDTCLLYTSDAADEEDSVDLGGRRLI